MSNDIDDDIDGVDEREAKKGDVRRKKVRFVHNNIYDSNECIFLGTYVGKAFQFLTNLTGQDYAHFKARKKLSPISPIHWIATFLDSENWLVASTRETDTDAAQDQAFIAILFLTCKTKIMT
jgi:hypothetical protein